MRDVYLNKFDATETLKDALGDLNPGSFDIAIVVAGQDVAVGSGGHVRAACRRAQ